MFVHGDFSGIPVNRTMNSIQHIGRNAVKQAALQQAGRAGLRIARDTFSLSPQGKANSALSGLEKLRQQIEDRRSEFLAKATEEGQSADSIQAQLDSFDQQLKDIDKQMAQMAVQQTNQAIEKAKNHTSSMSVKRPKTRQEVENQRLADITSMSSGLEKAETINSVKTQVDGDIGVKKSEIELEKSRGGDTTQMEAELAQLQAHTNQLTAGINDQLHDTLEEIKESNDKVIDTDIMDVEESEEKNDSKVEEDTAVDKADRKEDTSESTMMGAPKKESDAETPQTEV